MIMKKRKAVSIVYTLLAVGIISSCKSTKTNSLGNDVTGKVDKIENKQAGPEQINLQFRKEGKYTFLADLPYFIFQSTMAMKEEVSLKLLRNDEMTMDSLFTHVAYQKSDRKVSRLKLYDTELDSLNNNPIPDDSRFVAFYNTNEGYGLASIRLIYDNMNNQGNSSPTYKSYTKISKSSENGRYWNRVLMDSITTAPKGSRYHEKNAYLVFEVGSEIPEEQIQYYSKV